MLSRPALSKLGIRPLQDIRFTPTRLTIPFLAASAFLERWATQLYFWHRMNRRSSPVQSCQSTAGGPRCEPETNCSPMLIGYVFLTATILAFGTLGIFHKVADHPNCRPKMTALLLHFWGGVLSSIYILVAD